MTLQHRVQGQGEPLLLVAGTGFSGETWTPDMVSRLAERHTVITFDHRGTGRSAIDSEDLSTRLFAADALALMRDLGCGPAHVLGHSMGGRVAQWMALDGAEQVRSLILAASGAGREDGAAVLGIPLSQALGLAQKGYQRYMNEHIRATFFTPAGASSKAADWLVQAFWDSRPDLESYLKHVQARQQHRTTDLLALIAQPTLVLVGDRDTHAGGTGSHLEQSRYLARHLPTARYHELTGVSHGYFWEAPDPALKVVLEWLEDQSRGSR